MLSLSKPFHSVEERCFGFLGCNFLPSGEGKGKEEEEEEGRGEKEKVEEETLLAVVVEIWFLLVKEEHGKLERRRDVGFDLKLE